MKKNMNTILVLTVLCAAFSFAQEKALVFTNDLRIRNQPKLQGSKLGSISYVNGGGEITGLVTIYDKKGSGKMLAGGVWDLWYKITEDREEWVNAFYVATFPICFSYNLTYDGSDHIINDIDRTGIFDFTENRRGKISHKKEQNLVLKAAISDSSSIRLGEAVKFIKNKLSQKYSSEEIENSSKLPLAEDDLPFGLKKGMTRDAVKEILGDAITGSQISGNWDVQYPEKVYRLVIYFNFDAEALRYEYATALSHEAL